jgi:hypothetical protein
VLDIRLGQTDKPRSRLGRRGHRQRLPRVALRELKLGRATGQDPALQELTSPELKTFTGNDPEGCVPESSAADFEIVRL